MKHISNEEKAQQIAQYHCANELNLIQAYNAALDMAEWKDEQTFKEKQQLITKAMKVICNGCAQKVECEFNNWKTCSTKDELIKALEEQL